MKRLFSSIPEIEGEGLVLKRITMSDADALKEMVSSEAVYRYEPTFLFEKKYDDVSLVISRLYTECLEDSLILGIYREDEFCGIVELYDHREEIHKVSIGFRLMEKHWGKGIASKTVGLMVDLLYGKTDIEIIAASTLPENSASAHVLEKCGFSLVVRRSPEDWGYDSLLPTDKWIR